MTLSYKKDLRELLRHRRLEFSKTVNPLLIGKQLLVQFQSIVPDLSQEIIAGYEARGSEISVDKILDYCKTVCPVVLPQVDGSDLTFLPPITPTIILVPLIGFDARGNRLGQGGGYFDRYLARLTHKLTIGVAYDCQEVEEIPTEPHDIPLDYIITPTRIFTSLKH